ncbi:MAG: diguanylate cyclase [Oceanospirillales bacterium]|nr:diguanylate cyclase [Oceanospirillales bacterium]
MADKDVDQARYGFSDLVDLPAFERMLEHFYRATGIANGLVSEEGELLIQSGWESACTLFHRVSPESASNCRESNLELIARTQTGVFCGSHCSNGLFDYATPVVIEGQRVATLFLGQLLHEPPDMAFFKEQAHRFGFDETAYLASIAHIPVVEKVRVDALMACLVDMAEMLAKSGLARLRQRDMERDLSRQRKRQIQLEDILDSSPVAIGWSNASGKIEYINRCFSSLFGYTLDDLPDLASWYRQAYPDAHYREAVIKPWFSEISRLRSSGLTPPTLEASVTCKDGSTRRVMIHVRWVGDKRLVNFSDITAHWQSEKRNLAHDAMLGMVANGAPLSEILAAIVRQVQSEDEDSLCSVLLLDDEGRHLRRCVAPDLPDWYTRAIDGVEIGPTVGSCGAAAYSGERVIVDDITTHEFWRDHAELARQAGLRACWSEPIISSRGQVLGTFGIYHREPGEPSAEDIERIGFAANLAGIAIENRRTYEELESRAYYDYLTGLANRRFFFMQAENELARVERYGGELSVIMLDLDHFKRINDSYGHKVGDTVLKKLAELCLKVLREVDMVGRIGGEEFAILLPQTDKARALEVAERLRQSITDARMPTVKGVTIQFTASFGVSTLAGRAVALDTLLNEADQALYIAKRGGRNRVEAAVTPAASGSAGKRA